MIRRFGPLTLVLAAACGPQQTITTASESLWDFFPFDGLRSWSYISSDGELSYKLKADMREDDPDSELSSDVNIYHMDFSTDCVQNDPTCIEGAAVRTLGISSDVNTGTMLHSFLQGTVDITFDPPLVISPEDIFVGETIETKTDGWNWSATFNGYTSCEDIVAMSGDQFERSNCAAHITLADGDTNLDTNYGLAGDYYVAKGLGIVGIQLEGEDAIWGLSRMECDGDCDGVW